MTIVQADSVANYLDRYYKRERRTPTLLASYEEEFRRNGFVCTSRHDTVLGKFICWPHLPPLTVAEVLRGSTIYEEPQSWLAHPLLAGSPPSSIETDS